MIVKHLKKGWRITVTNDPSYRSKVLNFCIKQFPKNWETWEMSRWYVPLHRKKLYVYFKDEADVLLFIMSFNKKEM